MRFRLRSLFYTACSILVALGGCGGGDDNSSSSTPQVTLSLKDKCPTLANTALDESTTITAASIVSGSFTPPGAAAPLSVPELCRVNAVAKPVDGSNINFEIWLPTTWNNKYLSLGEGGFGGDIAPTGWQALQVAALRGYATGTTDTGHSGSSIDGDWIVGHPEKVIDWGYRAKHLQTIAAKELIQRFYASAPTKSYFAGCSNGGREGMMELQRYPDDFDGYLIGSPAFNWTGQTTLWAFENQVFADPASQIPSTKLPALKAASLAQCDALDGVADGIITNPKACTFNADALLCPAGQDNSTCFTAPQVASLKKVLAGPHDSAGRLLFPSDELGAETDNANWQTYVTSTAIRQTLGLFTYGRMLHNVTDYDPLNFNFDTDPGLLSAVLGPIVNATNTDLRAQKAKGIKIIHYVGWADAALAPQGSVNYYEDVATKVGGIDKAQEFYKLYMVPGMNHCYLGPGPNVFGQTTGGNYDPKWTAKEDVVKALEAWVEKGQAPDTITATKYAVDTDIKSAVLMKRPLCAHPKVQTYIGGDPTVESSFACR